MTRAICSISLIAQQSEPLYSHPHSVVSQRESSARLSLPLSESRAVAFRWRPSATPAWFDVWCLLAPLARAYCAWLQRATIQWTTANRRRVPSALYACERFQSQLASLLQSSAFKAHTGLAHPRRKERVLGERIQIDGSDSDEMASPCVEPVPPPSIISGGPYSQLLDLLVEDWIENADASEANAASASNRTATSRAAPASRASSRRKLRSRNPFIDAELSSKTACNDTFADLEDFIVCKRGRKY